ncbi:MAG: LPS assembly protein LptD [Hyphomicrobiales bacterium]
MSWRTGRALTAGVIALSVSLFAASPLFAQNVPEGATPPRDIKPELKKPAKGTPVDVTADKIVYDSKTQIATATGKVYILWGKYILEATKVVYNKKTDVFDAVGDVKVTEPGGNVTLSDKAQMRDGFKNGFAHHLKLLLTNDASVTADYAERTDGNITTYTHTTYTRCKYCVMSDGTPVWQLRAKESKHNQEERRIYEKDAILDLFGIPVAYFPWISHPDPGVKRASGWLIPSFGWSSVFGAGVRTPYFWNLAPNYDLTVSPTWTTRQGPLVDAEWRHRIANGAYSINAAGVYQFDTNMPPPGDRPFRGEVRAQGDYSINDRWNWGMDLTGITDETFGRQYNIDNRTELDNVVYLQGINDRNYMSAKAYQFVGLLEQDNNDQYPVVAPYIRHDYTYGHEVWGGVLGLDTNVYSLYRDEAVSPLDTSYTNVYQGTEQTRGVTTIHWQREIVTQGGVQLTPFGQVRADLYMNNNMPNPDNPQQLQNEQVNARVMPTGGVDLRWPFLRGDSTGTHIVTPVVQAFSSTNQGNINQIGNEDAITLNFDQSSLFLEDRFTGYDRVEGGTRVNAGLLYSYLMPSGGFIRASVGESFHLFGENSFVAGSGLEGQASDIVSGVALQPWDNLRLSVQARFDEVTFDMHQFEAGAWFNVFGLNASVNYVDLDAEPNYGRNSPEQQIWLSGDYQFWKGWSVFGGSRYDIQNGYFIQNMAGIGYDCDCANIKFYYREDYQSDRDIKPNTAVMLTVELKTLGTAKVGPLF